MLDEEMPDLGSEYDPMEVRMANQQDQCAYDEAVHGPGCMSIGGSGRASWNDDCSLPSRSDDEAEYDYEGMARQRKEHNAAIVIPQYENAAATKAALRERGVIRLTSEAKEVEDEGSAFTGKVANFAPLGTVAVGHQGKGFG